MILQPVKRAGIRITNLVDVYLRQFFARPNAMLVPAPDGGVTASTGLLAAERHAGVWTPVIAHKTISAEPQFALAA